MTLTLTKAQQAGLTRAQRDPAGWVRAFLGDDLWEAQIEILESVRDNRRTSVKSCHDSGKSHIAARAAVWYLNAHPDSIVVTTAPTYRQVRNIIWRSIGTAYASAVRPLLGRVLTDRLEINHQWYGFGFKADDNAATNFQGIHPISGRVLVIVDEAAGVAPGVFEGIDAAMTSEHARMLLIGNPTSPEGEFYDSFHRNRGMYHTITISADRTPNIRAGHTIRPYLLTQAWINDAVAKHGEDSPYVQARVYANFPTVGDKNLIPLAWIERAHHDDTPAGAEPAEAGLDVARYGGDENVLWVRRGAKALYTAAWTGLDTMETVGRARLELERFPDLARVKVDAIGLGAGVFDRFRELRRQKAITWEPVEVNVGVASRSPDSFANLRHELWWGLRERFREGRIAGPFDDLTMGQLSSIRYRYDSAHAMPLVESKDELRRRGLRSPDRAEALLLAFAEVGGTGGRFRVSDLDARARAARESVTERDRRADERGGRGGTLAGSRGQTF